MAYNVGDDIDSRAWNLKFDWDVGEQEIKDELMGAARLAVRYALMAADAKRFEDSEDAQKNVNDVLKAIGLGET